MAKQQVASIVLQALIQESTVTHMRASRRWKRWYRGHVPCFERKDRGILKGDLLESLSVVSENERLEGRTKEKDLPKQ